MSPNSCRNRSRGVVNSAMNPLSSLQYYRYPAGSRSNVRVVSGAAIHHAAARGFALAPEAYERGRPTYPADAIACLTRELDIGPGRRVLDLAAGTGKLTRLLAP